MEILDQNINDNKEQKLMKWVNIISIAIPLVVVLLFMVKIEGYDFSFLPPIYAGINFTTAICLIVAVFFIKKGNKKWHQRMINVAIILSILFLIGYVLYHMTSTSTKYEGDYGYIYFPLLISHIFLSIIVIPFVLRTYIKGYLGLLDGHKKFAKFTFPLWLYVAVSGVVVYWMISPFYL